MGESNSGINEDTRESRGATPPPRDQCSIRFTAVKRFRADLDEILALVIGEPELANTMLLLG